MDKGIQDLLDKLSLDTATYNINAVGYPSMIILRDDLRRVLDYIYKLQQQLKKKDEVIEKAISFIGSIDLSERPYVLYTDEIEELLQILEDKEAQ